MKNLINVSQSLGSIIFSFLQLLKTFLVQLGIKVTTQSTNYYFTQNHQDNHPHHRMADRANPTCRVQ